MIKCALIGGKGMGLKHGRNFNSHPDAEVIAVCDMDPQKLDLLEKEFNVPGYPSIDELLGAAEYILAQGNQQVILCERGIRTFETATRNTLDISAVPILKERTHLPVIVDPSHAAGRRDLVPHLAKAAKAVGADGIMVEIHPEPDKAKSDGPQSLTFAGFRKLMSEIVTMP